ncbi:MAG TPA: UDP-N-acetylmuramate dehydrogenase [Candidatus Saccharimonadales bacterium]|nr:UDP-N-acetylmuramate dehydrogenase [Candidatus Saccharimonadales bacterium]
MTPAAGEAVPAPTFDAIATGTEIQRRIGVKTSRDEPLARFTTMRVGGPADLFASVHNKFELRSLVRFARARAIPYLILGRGSDVVISDRGWRGLVIQSRAEESSFDGDRYTAAAGVPMARAATETQRAGLSGLEFGLAIPGSVGGAVWANAGAHESDIAGVLVSARLLASDGTEAVVEAADLGLAYRDTRLKHPPAGGPPDLVLEATFQLAPADPEVIKERLDDIRRWRQAHQPLGLPSAGSVFRNPDGDSAGRLIDAAGLKGTRLGGAVVSEKHANFIVNDRKGTAADVRHLGEHVQRVVHERHGVDLRFEIEFVGDWTDWPWPSAEPTPPDATHADAPARTPA